MLTFDRCVANLLERTGLDNIFTLLGRVLISYIFITAGWAKIGGYAGTAAYMESKGLPSALLVLVILLELGGGLAILVGYQTRIVAFFFAVFCIVSGLIFHGAPEEATSLLKNISIAGGFLFLLAQGAGKFSLDNLLTKKS